MLSQKQKHDPVFDLAYNVGIACIDTGSGDCDNVNLSTAI